MLYDLTRNILKPNFTTKKQIDSLLGKHNRIDSLDSSLVFDVYEKYGWNIDPEGYISLKLYFTKDSILQQWKIEDTSFNP